MNYTSETTGYSFLFSFINTTISFTSFSFPLYFFVFFFLHFTFPPNLNMKNKSLELMVDRMLNLTTSWWMNGWSHTNATTQKIITLRRRWWCFSSRFGRCVQFVLFVGSSHSQLYASIIRRVYLDCWALVGKLLLSEHELLINEEPLNTPELSPNLQLVNLEISRESIQVFETR